MDARIAVRVCTLSTLLILMSGCGWYIPAPAVRREPPLERRQPQEPALVAQQPAGEQPAPDAQPVPAADPVEQKVLDYIARIEEASRQARPAGGAVPLAPRKAGARSQLAADEHVSSSTTVERDGMMASGAATTRVVAPADDQGADAPRAPAPDPAAPHAAASEPKPPANTASAAGGTPKIVKVSARPAPGAGTPSPAPRDAPPQPPPGVNATAAAAPSELPALRDALAPFLASTDGSSFRAQLDARVLQVLAGEYEKAREPLTLVSAEQQALAQRFVGSLIAIREAHLGDPAGGARTALGEIEQLAATLRQASDLAIPTLVLCREVRGFGQYQPIEPARFASGTAVEFVVYLEVRDFSSQKRGDGWYHTQFDLKTAVLSHGGDTVLELDDPGIVDRCRNRRTDCFIPRLVRLPATLSPGEYTVKVTLTDRLAEKVCEARGTFRVEAR